MIHFKSVLSLLCDPVTNTIWYSKSSIGQISFRVYKCRVYVVVSKDYWSSTPNASDESKAWNVNFNNGNDNWNNKSNSNFVRCVRESKYV